MGSNEEGAIRHVLCTRRFWLRARSKKGNDRDVRASFCRKYLYVSAEISFPRKISIVSRLSKDDSSLECSEHMRFCRARNVLLNFTDLLYRKEPIRYKMDVLKEGQIGGYCT